MAVKIQQMADITEQDSSINPLNALKKQAIEKLTDPVSGLSEQERTAYENRIYAKLKSGKRLTSEEMEYLRIHNPAMYRTALRVKLKKDQLKEQLKHCRSKEEAERVISSAINGVSEKDPDREYLIAGLSETARNFKKDAGYARLPDTAEEAKKKKHKKTVDFKDDDGEASDVTPIQELIDILPVFDVVQ